MTVCAWLGGLFIVHLLLLYPSILDIAPEQWPVLVTVPIFDEFNFMLMTASLFEGAGTLVVNVIRFGGPFLLIGV